MKRNKMIIFLFCVVFFISSPSLAVDKAELYVFFKDLCDACHGAKPKFNLASARAGYYESGHRNHGNAFYANGEGCQQCHTHEGFIEYLEKGAVDPKAYVKTPSQPGCNTCHDPHATGDLSLRKISPVTTANGKKYDIGKGNLCANCHQARRNVSDTVTSLPANEISGHWGAHHGSQADMLIGTSAYEYSGKTYYSSVHSILVKNSCPECHMTLPAGRYSFAPDMAGHSFSMVGEVHHEPKLNVSGCLGSCHGKVGQVKAVHPDTPAETFWWHQTEVLYDIQAKADFDQDGTVEPLQAEIEGLLNLFVNNKGTGYLQKGNLPMYKKDGSWNKTGSKEMRPLKEVAALYNYKFVLEDRSRGIHNAPYTIQILYDTIQSLDPSFDVSKRNVYKHPSEYKPAELIGRK